MNAKLIHPAFPPTFWSYKYAIRFIRKKAALPPLGLLTVAAMLPAAWPKRLVDLNDESICLHGRRRPVTLPEEECRIF